ncbi:MAG: MFS transporter, partial [Syntrophothermus sp.]
IIVQPLVGLMSDNIWFWGGRRRPFIFIGAALAALMLFALPNIDIINNFLGIGSILIVALIVALLLDISINVSFNPTRSIIADVTPEGEKRTKGYTWMQTISGAFGMGAYAISAIWGNYVLIYLGIFVVLALSIIPSLFIEEPRYLDTKAVSEGDAPKEKKSKADKPARSTQLGEMMKLYVAHGFSWIGIQTMFVFMFAFISQKIFQVADPDQSISADLSMKITQVQSLSFLILNAVGFILPALLLEPIAKRIGRVKTHLLSVAAMALGYLGILFFARDPFTLYIMIGICGIGWAAIVSLPFAILSEKVNKTEMGLFMGIFNLSVVIPQLIVSLFIGYFIKNIADKNIIFIISGICLSISAVLWLTVKETVKGQSQETPLTAKQH